MDSPTWPISRAGPRAISAAAAKNDRHRAVHGEHSMDLERDSLAAAGFLIGGWRRARRPAGSSLAWCVVRLLHLRPAPRLWHGVGRFSPTWHGYARPDGGYAWEDQVART